MARFRLAGPAQADLANILATSAERWGTEGRRRYLIEIVRVLHERMEPRRHFFDTPPEDKT